VQPAEFALTPSNPPAAGVCFDALFRDHYPRIVALLARLTGDRGQAEEIASDVFCKLAQRPTLAGSDGVLPWVYRVATNAGLDALRSNSRRRRREEVAGMEDLRNGRQDDALNGILRQERCANVRAVLGTLKPRDAELLLLRAEGMAYRELAEALGVQPGSIGTLLARAEAEFERRFRARYGENV
jgi:RNA polymerase sigma-70 factor, ECF subfamily